MKNRKHLKGLLIISIGLIGLISTFIINISIEHDSLCIFIMLLFLIIEIYGLSNILKDKYELR